MALKFWVAVVLKIMENFMLKSIGCLIICRSDFSPNMRSNFSIEDYRSSRLYQCVMPQHAWKERQRSIKDVEETTGATPSFFDPCNHTLILVASVKDRFPY